MRNRLTISGSLCLLTLLAALIAVPKGSAAPALRAYAAGAFGLELDGAAIGYLKSFAGGSAVGQVVESVAGRATYAKKSIGGVSYEDISLELGMAMGKPLYDWLAAMVSGNAQRKSGAIVGYDTRFAAVSRREFDNALVSEITVPPCDAASKEPGYLTVKLTPEVTRVAAAAGKESTAVSKGDKAWLSSQFRLELGDLDTKRVIKVDAITIKQTIASDRVGAARDASKTPGRVAVSNLRVTLPEASGAPWQKWFEQFVLQGKSGDKEEKSGRLVLLSPTMKDELLELKLFNVGIVALRPAPAEAGSDAVAKLEAELYVERVELAFPAAK